MENASKALLIAGSMLLMVLVLTFAIYMFRRIGGQTAELYGEIRESDISEFNQKFFNYDGREDLTIHDVVSIINLAKDGNKNSKLPVDVKVYIDGSTDNYVDKSASEINKLLVDASKSSEEKKYKCDVSYASNSKLVGKVEITE